MTNNVQITASALRWFTARQRCMAIGSEQRRYQEEREALIGLGSADCNISDRHKQAKRLELQATMVQAKAWEHHMDYLM